MNLMFILIVCFGVLFLAVVIVTSIFDPNIGGSGPPLMWKRRLRQFQGKMENAGWRIQTIPYDDGSKPITLNTGGLLGVLPVLGSLGFVTGLAIATYDDRKYSGRGLIGLIVAVSSFATALCGYWLRERFASQGWDVAPARCVDRELRKVWLSPRGGGGTWGWVWRIVCQYEYLGIPYRVTPEVYRTSFNSEPDALKFLDDRISANGGCMLRVNPKNPLQTKLMDQAVKDDGIFT